MIGLGSDQPLNATTSRILELLDTQLLDTPGQWLELAGGLVSHIQNSTM